MLSLITTCKNRLSHLKQTLPLMLQQPSSEVIVVDYGCEHGTAAWVREHHPTVKVVQVNDDPVFCVARARNMGAKNASHELLCFIDADVLLQLELGKWLEFNQDPNVFYLRPAQTKSELDGFLIVSREHFSKVGGYDEAMRGWGGEDFDLYERLARAGLSKSSVPRASISSIPHGDELRQLSEAEGGFGSRRENLSMIQLYGAIKRDSLRLTGIEVELEQRKALLQFIRTTRSDALREDRNSFEISINVPMDSGQNQYLKGQRMLHYQVPLKRPIK